MRGKRKQPYATWAEWDAEHSVRLARAKRVERKANETIERAWRTYDEWVFDLTLKPKKSRKEERGEV